MRMAKKTPVSSEDEDEKEKSSQNVIFFILEPSAFQKYMLGLSERFFLLCHATHADGPNAFACIMHMSIGQNVAFFN